MLFFCNAATAQNRTKCCHDCLGVFDRFDTSSLIFSSQGQLACYKFMTPEVLPRLPSHAIPVIGCHSEHKPIPLATDHKEWQGGAQCHLVGMLPEQRPPSCRHRCASSEFKLTAVLTYLCKQLALRGLISACQVCDRCDRVLKTNDTLNTKFLVYKLFRQCLRPRPASSAPL